MNRYSLVVMRTQSASAAAAGIVVNRVQAVDGHTVPEARRPECLAPGGTNTHARGDRRFN